MISDDLRLAVKASPCPAYRLAYAIGVDPSTLSAWLNGIKRLRDGDPRVLRLAELLGVDPANAFAPDPDPAALAHELLQVAASRR